MTVAGKGDNEANEVLRLLKDDVFDKEKFFIKKLPGNGRWGAKLVTIQNAIELISVLPGTTAKIIRTKISNYIVRILGGDPTLITEIEDNAASTAPINVMARDALASEQRLDDGRLDELVRSVPQQQTVIVTGLEELKPIVAIVQQQAATNERMSAALIAQTQQFSATTALQAQQLDQANAATDRERTLRHQADGRYGSGVREANKETRAQAAFWERQAHRGEQMVQEQRGWMRDMGERLAEMQAVTLRLAERLADRAV